MPIRRTTKKGCRRPCRYEERLKREVGALSARAGAGPQAFSHAAAKCKPKREPLPLRRPLPCPHAARPATDSAAPSGFGEPVRFPRLPPDQPIHLPSSSSFADAHSSPLSPPRTGLNASHRRGVRVRQLWLRSSCCRAGCAGRDRVHHGPPIKVEATSALIAGSFTPRPAPAGGESGRPPGIPAFGKGLLGVPRGGSRVVVVLRVHDRRFVLSSLLRMRAWGARPCDGDFSCHDRMLVGYRCSGPLVPCDGGAHAPPERRLCVSKFGRFGKLIFLSRHFCSGRGAPRNGFQGLEWA